MGNHTMGALSRAQFSAGESIFTWLEKCVIVDLYRNIQIDGRSIVLWDNDDTSEKKGNVVSTLTPSL